MAERCASSPREAREPTDQLGPQEKGEAMVPSTQWCAKPPVESAQVEVSQLTTARPGGGTFRKRHYTSDKQQEASASSMSSMPATANAPEQSDKPASSARFVLVKMIELRPKAAPAQPKSLKARDYDEEDPEPAFAYDIPEAF